MKRSLAMNFSVDRDKRTIHVEREFAAPLADVWAAWTQKEFLDQWWAPKPYRTITRSLDFRDGGTWFYSMVGPENDRHWCRADYEGIQPMESFGMHDAFTDEEGNVSNELPRSRWKNDFRSSGDSTTVHITIRYDKTEDLDKIIELGFREGFTAALENLDEMFEKELKS
ncbi:MAG: SRPBCC domain-containing protein [Cyclobacteriaceae bacterium]|nr:SRPBCC domain-containing protein [Cyclobacteriaceae bacterium]